MTKLPGSVSGQPFNIIDCKNCTILILDHCDQIQIDNCTNSKIFIGASSGSIFLRNCQNCKLTVACKQFRTRDCVDCNVYLYCKTEPIIESSTNLKFAPFNGAYPGHDKAMVAANLNPEQNLWYAIYDFNDESKSGVNWSYVQEEDEEEKWCPLGPADNICPRILPGKDVAVGSKEDTMCDVSLEVDETDEISPLGKGKKKKRKRSRKKEAATTALLSHWTNIDSVSKVLCHLQAFFGLMKVKIPEELKSLPSKATGWLVSLKDTFVSFVRKQEQI